jgi:predicted DNA binding CopG/RHH family protein
MKKETKIKKKILKKVPKFKNEDEELEFWENHSITDYYDIKDFKRATFPNLKRTEEK